MLSLQQIVCNLLQNTLKISWKETSLDLASKICVKWERQKNVVDVFIPKKENLYVKITTIIIIVVIIILQLLTYRLLALNSIWTFSNFFMFHGLLGVCKGIWFQI